MFLHDLQIALRSFKRHKALTALMILAIALGIGAAMTTMTIFKVLAGDPIAQKSQRLFHVQLDPRPASTGAASDEPLEQLTRRDAENLLHERRAHRQALMNSGMVAVQTESAAIAPFKVPARFSSADFFPMFDVPLRLGRGWSEEDEQRRATVAVIGARLNDKLFDGTNSVGKRLRVEGHVFTIIGVLDDWRPTPRFYDLSSGAYTNPEQVFLPFATALDLELRHNGRLDCFDEAIDPFALDAPCTWIQYWVELQTPAQAAAFKTSLNDYSARQRAAGRDLRRSNTRLRNVMQWLDHNRVVPGDVRLQLWLALGFLLVCLLNTVGLLLAKFMRDSGEIGIRRALGATRAAIFTQALVEAGAIGMAGGIGGLSLTWLGLWGVRQQPVDYAPLAHLDLPMLAATLVAAVLASLLAGLLPAWQAARITPAMQLKTQ